MKETGNLRTDLGLENEVDDLPASWDDLKNRVTTALHGDMEETKKKLTKPIIEQVKDKENVKEVVDSKR